MEPLSVAASVVGLLAAAAKMAGILKKLTDAPELAATVLTEMNDITLALHHLQNYLSGAISVPASRGQLILLEHMAAPLTACVITYSKLEAIIDSLHIKSKMGVFDQVKWAMREKEIRDIVQCMQNHKSSLTLMLMVLQCKSNQEAERSVMRLCDLVGESLRNDENLASRLHRLEETNMLLDTGDLLMARNDDDSRTASVLVDQPNEVFVMSGPYTRQSFEATLQKSRVYLRSLLRHSESSLTSSTMQTAAISMFSSLSLGDVSNISVFSLPIYAIDISNSGWYSFGSSSGDGGIMAGKAEDVNRDADAGNRPTPASAVNLRNMWGLIALSEVPVRVNILRYIVKISISLESQGRDLKGKIRVFVRGHQHLTFKDYTIRDDSILKECGIKKGSTIHVHCIFRGVNFRLLKEAAIGHD